MSNGRQISLSSRQTYNQSLIIIIVFITVETKQHQSYGNTRHYEQTEYQQTDSRSLYVYCICLCTIFTPINCHLSVNERVKLARNTSPPQANLQRNPTPDPRMRAIVHPGASTIRAGPPNRSYRSRKVRKRPPVCAILTVGSK